MDWPTDFWREPLTDADTDEYRAARDAASLDVLRRRSNHPIVAVSGSGDSHHYQAEANELGRMLAELGFTLTTGGLDGVMFDVTNGYVQVQHTRGKAIGIVPKGKGDKAEALAKRLPSAHLVYTALPGTDSHGSAAGHLSPSSRNHVLIATADAVICMPGKRGSIAEAELATMVYHKHVIAFCPGDSIDTDWYRAVSRLRIPVVKEVGFLRAWLNGKLRSEVGVGP